MPIANYLKKKNKKVIILIIATKIRYLESKLTKGRGKISIMKTVFKKLTREIKEETINGKICCILGLKDLILFKYLHSPN